MNPIESAFSDLSFLQWDGIIDRKDRSHASFFFLFSALQSRSDN